MIGKNKKIGLILLLIGAVLVAAQSVGLIPPAIGESDRLALLLLGLGLIILGIKAANIVPVKYMDVRGAAYEPVESWPWWKKILSDKNMFKNVLLMIPVVVYVLRLFIDGNVFLLRELALICLGYVLGKNLK